MAEAKQFSWDDKNFLDDTDFQDKDAQAFKALLTSGGGEAGQEFEPGTLLKGKIVEISKDYAVIDVGLKSEGLVPVSEFVDPKELELGQEIEVFLETSEDDYGQIVLSRERARRQRQWEHIVDHCEEGSIVPGTVIRKVKGGLIVDIGMEAFLPGSQVDNRRIKNLDEFLGRTFDFKILKINIDRKNVVISRREVLEAERMAKKSELLDDMQIGELRSGVVKNITDFGVFLDLDGLDGLLHITDMTWKRIRHPSEMVKIGDELEVAVLSIDKDKGRVALGLKQKEANPWDEIEARFPPGTIVKGKIVNLVSYGAFIELEEGVEGLIHISEMSWTRNVTEPSEVVTKGDEVEAMVLSVQKEEQKISLGMKQVQENPWENVSEKYKINDKVEGEVKSLTNYGAFVGLEPGIDGLIHISDFSWTEKISHPSEMLKVGDKVEALILSVDGESKKITLGVKQLAHNPWDNIEKELAVGSVVKGEVVKVAAFGVTIQLDKGLNASVDFNELSDRPFGKVEDIMSVGDTVSAIVTGVDPERKKIAVSVKEYLVQQGKENLDDIVIGDKKE